MPLPQTTGPAGPVRAYSLTSLGLGSVAIRLTHLQIALALAGVLTLAGIVGTLAGGVSLAGVHPLALHLGLFRVRARQRRAREHDRRGGRQGDTQEDS